MNMFGVPNYTINKVVGVSGATTKLQTYWDKMGVENKEGENGDMVRKSRG
jgi:hypothetical protein